MTSEKTEKPKYPSEIARRIFVRLEPKIDKAFRESLIENKRSQSAEVNFIMKKHYKI